MIHNLTIYPGATFSLDFTWTDENDDPVDTTGYTGRSQVRSHANADTVALDFDVTVNNDGTGTIAATATETGALDLPAEKGVWDLELEASDGTVYRLLYGKVTTIPEVTR